jgi:hypothetical protein
MEIPMPLERGKSKAAFSHNVSAEMHAGKPQKQAVAIAYSEKAKAEHKKHLAMGGKVPGCHYCMGGYAEGGMVHYDGGGPVLDPDKVKQFQQGSIFNPQGAPTKKAEGGEIEEPMDMDHDNDALMDHCAMEFMNAIETGDKEAFKNAFHVLVADVLNKLSMDMDEGDES